MFVVEACIGLIPLISVIASIGSSVAGFAQAQQQANAQNAAYQANWRASIVAMDDKYAALNNNTLQEKEAASQQLFQKQVEALQARGKAATAAGDAGVTGLSVAALQADLEAQQARQFDAIDTNFQIKKQHNVDEGIATQNQAIARIQSVRQAANPSAGAYILQGIGGAANALGRTHGGADYAQGVGGVQLG